MYMATDKRIVQIVHFLILPRNHNTSGPIAQSILKLIADPEVMSSIPAQSLTSVEMKYHEIFHMVIFSSFG